MSGLEGSGNTRVGEGESVAAVRRRRVTLERALWPGVVVSCVIVGGAFLLSFTALRDVAVALRSFPPGFEWVYPVIIDGVILLATWAAWRFRQVGMRAVWYPWTVLAVYAGGSVFLNGLHAQLGGRQLALTGWQLPVFAAVPPLSMLVATHMIVWILTYRREASTIRRAGRVRVQGPARIAQQAQPVQPVEVSLPRSKDLAGRVDGAGAGRVPLHAVPDAGGWGTPVRDSGLPGEFVAWTARAVVAGRVPNRTEAWRLFPMVGSPATVRRRVEELTGPGGLLGSVDAARAWLDEHAPAALEAAVG